MPHPSKRKGDKIERQLVNLHKEAGIEAKRVDARMGQYGKDASHDIDVYMRGLEEAPLCGEIKARSKGQGFATLERWMGDNDFLILKRDRAEPMVAIPWRIWVELLQIGRMR